MSSSLAAGLALSLLSVLNGFAALNLQRFAQRKSDPRPVLNLVAVVMHLLCGPLDMASFVFAPQSLLAPIEALPLLLNLVAAPRLHGDPVSTEAVGATVLVVVGVTICLYWGAHGHGAADGVAGPSATALGIYTLALLSALAALRWLVAVWGSSVHVVAHAVSVGLLGSSTVVAGKHAVNSVAAGVLWRICAGVVPAAIAVPAHMYTLNRGMALYSTVLFVPLQKGAGMAANVATGLLLYGEGPSSPSGFVCGAAVVLFGVLSLTLQSGAAAADGVVVELGGVQRRRPFLDGEREGDANEQLPAAHRSKTNPVVDASLGPGRITSYLSS